MTIRLRSIDLSTTTKEQIAGVMVLHDDDPARDIEVDVFPSPTPPGYLISLHRYRDTLTDWPVFAVAADRMIRGLLLTAEEAARREAAVRRVITQNRVEGSDDDPDMEVLLWRFARGEYDIDGLDAAVTVLHEPDKEHPGPDDAPAGENS